MYNNTVPNERLGIRPNDPAGEEVEVVCFIPDNHSVSGIVSTLAPRNKVGGNTIYQFEQNNRPRIPPYEGSPVRTSLYWGKSYMTFPWRIFKKIKKRTKLRSLDVIKFFPLLPYLQITSIPSANRSTTFPFPSSPHCAPSTTITRFSVSPFTAILKLTVNVTSDLKNNTIFIIF